ncbi:MAG: hypothetical protein JW829_04765 [Pirellulales bacterium]|nr:hypothetical protein [Pirellulales bacterium]
MVQKTAEQDELKTTAMLVLYAAALRPSSSTDSSEYPAFSGSLTQPMLIEPGAVASQLQTDPLVATAPRIDRWYLPCWGAIRWPPLIILTNK